MRKTKLILFYIILYISFIFTSNTSFAYFGLTNKDKSSLFEKVEAGDWEFKNIEDPITDEVTYSVCRNSNDRVRDNGSGSKLCIEYNKSTSKLSAYITDDCTSHDKTTYEIIRYGKQKPHEETFPIELIRGMGSRFMLNPFTTLDEILKGNKLAIRIENYNGIKGMTETYVYEANKSVFEKVANPLLEAINKK